MLPAEGEICWQYFQYFLWYNSHLFAVEKILNFDYSPESLWRNQEKVLPVRWHSTRFPDCEYLYWKKVYCSDNEARGTKRKHSESEDSKDCDREDEKDKTSVEIEGITVNMESSSCGSKAKTSDIETDSQPATGMKCIGILPGLGSYDDSSDSDCSSSDSDHEHDTCHTKYDLLGRKIQIANENKS